MANERREATRKRRPRYAVACIATLILMVSSGASAGVVYTASASSSDGSALSAISIGAQIFIDITIRTTDHGVAVAASANNYDNTLVSFNAAASVIPETIFDQFCFPAAGCVGGLSNRVGGPIALEEQAVGPGVEVEFLDALSVSPAGGNGSLDPGWDGTIGGPQVRLVFDWIGYGGSTTINIGTFAAYLDSYSGTVDSLATNTSITVTNLAPEPGTALLIGLGLAGLTGTQRRSRV